MPLPVNREDIDEDINQSVIIYGLSKVTEHVILLAI